MTTLMVGGRLERLTSTHHEPIRSGFGCWAGSHIWSVTMAGSFDPYLTWLEISDPTRPLNFYQLLGLEPGEGSIEVISAAAKRQAARIQPHVSGEHGRIAKRALIEIESARLCLTTPDKKAEYDSGLKRSRQRSSSVSAGSLKGGNEEELSLQPIDAPRGKSALLHLKQVEEKAQLQAKTPAHPAEPRTAPSQKTPAAAPRVLAPADPLGPLDNLGPLDGEVVQRRRKKARFSFEQLSLRQQIALGLAGGALVGVACLGVFFGVRQVRQLAGGLAFTTTAAGTPRVSEPAPSPVATEPPPPPVAVAPADSPKPTPETRPSTTEPAVGFSPSAPFPPSIPQAPEPSTVPAPPLPRNDGPLPVPTEPFRSEPKQNLPQDLPFDPLPAKPRAEPERGPFALLPRSVELPPIAGAKLGNAVPLGRIDLPGDAPISLRLLSHINGLKSGFRYALEPAAGERAWDVYATEFQEGSDGRPLVERAHVARFSLTADQDLNFAWHDEASSAASSSLRNAVLVLESTTPDRVERFLPLRSPQPATVTRLDPERGDISVPLKGEGLPDRALLRFALVDATGFVSGSVVHPATATATYKDQVRLIIRNATSQAPGMELRFKLQSANSGVALQIASLVVDVDGDTLPFHQSRIHSLAMNVPRDLADTRRSISELQGELKAIDLEVRGWRSRIPNDVQDAQRIEFNIGVLLKKAKRLSGSLADRQKALVQQARLASIAPDLMQHIDRLQTTARFNYRVYFVCGGREVDVLTSN